MIYGIGIDIVDIDRFRKAYAKIGDSFLKKIFTDRELSFSENKKNRLEHLSGKFAAKEAVKKSLPEGARIGLAWYEIEILNGADGKPYVELHGEAEKIKQENNIKTVFVSISHAAETAVANAIAEG
ncbi:MAG: holo-ACP synthase [Candidatus Omnitrophica bacterium]|nr:holo-ACP synthase [Candidatus Omnitrophota bacterium]